MNALCEQPLNGDIYALCGDSNVHVLRPAAAKQADCDPRQAILPQTFTHPDPLINFYIRMSLSPDCKYLACGSSSGGVMTWDTRSAQAAATPVRVQVPNDPNQPEFVAVDWAKDMVSTTR